VRIAGAAAEIAIEAVSDLVAGGLGTLAEEFDAGHDHPGRAVTALQAVTFPKRFLHRMQAAVLGETFDGGDFATVGLGGEHRAGFHGAPIEQNCACSAERGFAADMGAGQLAVVAKQLDEKRARFHFVLLWNAIDLE